MTDKLDDDIAALAMSDGEKWGLQVYRNYTRAFDNHAEKAFAKLVDNTGINFTDVRHVASLVANEDIRFVPVIASAYAEDLFTGLFRKHVPEGVPGGKRSLFGPYGPLSDYAGKLKL